MAGVKNVRDNKSTSPIVFYSVKMKLKEIYLAPVSSLLKNYLSSQKLIN